MPHGEDPGVPAARMASEPIPALLTHLHTGTTGLSEREAARRLEVLGPNVLHRRAGWGLPAAVLRQLVHPLALLLWAAAALAALGSTIQLAVAIVAVVILNAGVAVAQERHAERSLDALRLYLPPQARVVRDGREVRIAAAGLVPGDLLLLTEGERVSADARLLTGELQVDTSLLTGESVPVTRRAGDASPGVPRADLVFSGTACVGGDASAVVLATGMRTEIGRIAALSQRTTADVSPLEEQVRRLARLLALVAVGAGLAVLALGSLVAGLPLGDAVDFAIGLLVANVPEGLLPTITLALAVGVRRLARRGALVKRLSAVEGLGATTVICTDKTGTLTENRMRVVEVDTGDDDPDAARGLLARAMACTTAAGPGADAPGDPTERALIAAAIDAGLAFDAARTDRRALLPFDSARRLMTTVEAVAGGAVASTKGAPEEVVARCAASRWGRPTPAPMTAADRDAVRARADALSGRGLRVLAIAERALPEDLPADREDVERDLVLLGLVAMADPPRATAAGAVARCREAGIRIIVVTGDAAPTAVAVARAVGIAGDDPTVVTGATLDAMAEPELDRLLTAPGNLIVARASPEAKLRITDALRALDEVVTMTGDGVNDAPALRRADIGVAMGLSGTDVAREASTVVLTDDDFSTIVAAVHEGRRVFDSVRKFVLYIFAHTVPEVVPFLLFALSGGAIPLPLTVMQILAIDLGTETLPALALGREPAEEGVMRRPPQPRRTPIVDRALLIRAWAVMGITSALLVTGGFLAVLLEGGWRPGAEVGEGTPLNEVYLQATTITFLGIVACQIGTALASRSARTPPPLRRIASGNPLLLAGIAFEVAVAAVLVAVPALQPVFGTAVPPAWALAMLLPFPVLVLAADRLWLRSRRRS